MKCSVSMKLFYAKNVSLIIFFIIILSPIGFAKTEHFSINMLHEQSRWIYINLSINNKQLFIICCYTWACVTIGEARCAWNVLLLSVIGSPCWISGNSSTEKTNRKHLCVIIQSANDQLYWAIVRGEWIWSYLKDCLSCNISNQVCDQTHSSWNIAH